MPQLIPYYYVNQASFTLLGLGIIIYISARYFLPYILSLQVIRTYITTL